jgi:hypothetical protein
VKQLAAPLSIWLLALGAAAVAVAQPAPGKAPAPAPAPGQAEATAPAPATAVLAKHFSHSDHRGRGVDVDRCQACHSVDARGQVLAPAAQGHAPCLDARCHAADFLAVGEKARVQQPAQFAKASALCLGCHVEVPWPWKKPATRVLKAYQGSREHHIEMNHHQHTLRAKLECRSCHVVEDKSFALAAGTPGHAQCGKCHDAKAAPGAVQAPFSMKECGVCHLRESRADYLQRLEITESRPKTDVRACGSEGHEQAERKQRRKVPCFKHERAEHRTLNGNPVQCVSCHFIVGDKAQWGRRRYVSLADLQVNPIIWNAKDQQHESCGRVAACHKRDVDPVSGAKCNLCHADKSVF